MPGGPLGRSSSCTVRHGQVNGVVIQSQTWTTTVVNIDREDAANARLSARGRRTLSPSDGGFGRVSLHACRTVLAPCGAQRHSPKPQPGHVH